jgi:hypothetical protein
MNLICTQYNAVLHAYIPIQISPATAVPRLRLVQPRLSNPTVCRHHPPRAPHSTPPHPHVCPLDHPPLNLSIELPLSLFLASSPGISSSLTQTDLQSLSLYESRTVSRYAILISNWYVFLFQCALSLLPRRPRPRRLDSIPFASVLLRADLSIHHSLLSIWAPTFFTPDGQVTTAVFFGFWTSSYVDMTSWPWPSSRGHLSVCQRSPSHGCGQTSQFRRWFHSFPPPQPHTRKGKAKGDYATFEHPCPKATIGWWSGLPFSSLKLNLFRPF